MISKTIPGLKKFHLCTRGNVISLERFSIFSKKRSTPTDILLAKLKTCSKTRNLNRGKQVHSEVIELGKDSNVYVGGALVNMYAKCGSMVDSRRVFDNMKDRNVVSWTALILGYAENGQGLIALELFTRMRTEGPAPDSVALIAAIKACTTLKLQGTNKHDWCTRLRDFAFGTRLVIHQDVANTLINMYTKYGNLVDARGVFDAMKNPDVVSWNVLILGYADNGEGSTALEMFTRMRNEGPAPDSLTFIAALKACTSLAVKGKWAECLNRGREIHNLAVRTGCDTDICVQSTLIDMYAKCGCMVEARKVFDGMKERDVVKWTALIQGYADCGQGSTALDMFFRMKYEGYIPNRVTFVAALKACISLAVNEAQEEYLGFGMKIHRMIVENRCDTEMYVQNTLIDMYGKCGSIVHAREVFEGMKHQDVVSWNVLIMGYVDAGDGHVALDMFSRMKKEGPVPNVITYVAALKACSVVGNLETGRRIHREIHCQVDLGLINCLVDFYAKCGSMKEAQKVFEDHADTRDRITWNALLSGFSNCGDHEHAFELFERMQSASFQPDSVTLVCVLSCCSHAGFLEKGKKLFETMVPKYGVVPTAEHYSCMVDSLGRAKKLDDAMALLQCMSCNRSEVTWTIILGACCRWKNLEVGRLAFQSWIDWNNRDPTSYVFMGQLYGNSGMLQEKETVMKMSKKLQSQGEYMRAVAC